LETKPNISVVFAALWKWNLSPARTLNLEISHSHVLEAFCEHVVNMLELDAAVSTIFATLLEFEPSIFDGWF
jgi:hypothetical protein